MAAARAVGSRSGKLAVVAALVLFTRESALAQAPAWRWVAQSKESGAAVVQQVVADAAGNGYITGQFSKQIHFGALALQSLGSSDVFIAKVGADGRWLWALAAGGAEADKAGGLVVDGAGTVTVAGSFTGTAHFGNFTQQSQGGQDGFVAVISASGEWRTVTTAGGNDQDQITALTLDAQQNVFVGGRFRGQATFGPSTLRSTADADAFVAKIDAYGQWQWARQTYGTEQTILTSLSVDGEGELYAAGYFAGNTRFGTTRLTSAGTHDAFVAKMGSTGTWQWATSGGGTSTDYVKGLAVSAEGNVFITGSFSGQATFGPTALASQGSDDAYVAQLDARGKWQWVAPIAGSALEDGTAICLGSGGSIFVAGRFSQGARYGATTLTSQGRTDAFVAQLSQTGQWLGFLTAGSTAPDELTAIGTGPHGEVYVGGIVGAATRFGALPAGATAPQVFIGRVAFPAYVAAGHQ
ncbi:hypothetical protein GCM10022408_25050 [Hymenobacter fastidiosus]|uniref:SBBP repeat-containing protein n=1 Tax=Hymenobacter fastidiosus TaxID=486264 RepID=A0ABP7SH00_9BACT